MSRNILDIFNSVKSSKYFGPIKSFAILLLAVASLVTSVLAWFSTNDSATAEGMSITVSTSDAITVSRGSASISESLELPAATMPDDNEVAADSLAKVLIYKWYKVEANEASSFSLDFNLVNDGLICYCFTVADEEAISELTNTDCAGQIKSNTGNLVYYDDMTSTVIHSPQTFALNNGVCYLIIVYMADYDKVGGSLYSGTGSANMAVDLSFVPAE